METFRKLRDGPKFGAVWGGDDEPAAVQQQTVSNEPPGFLAGPLTRFVGRAEEQSNVPLEFFPGQTFADQSQATEAGLQLATQRALEGSPVVGAAGEQLQQTLAGDFLQNPFQNQLTESIVGAVAPRINAQFQMAGRAGSPAQANALASAVTDRLGPLAFQNFGQERNRQLQAAQFAPTFGQEDFRNAAALQQVGQAREAQTQRGINEAIERFRFNQFEPIERLSLLGTRLQGGNFGGFSTATGTTTQPNSGNLSNLFGAGLGGLGLASLLFGS